MAQREVIHSLVIALAALFTSASAVPMMPYSMGLMGFGGGMFGGNGGDMMRSHIGATYRGGAASFSSSARSGGYMSAPVQSPTVLNGVDRTFAMADDALVDGLAVTISSPLSNDMGPHGGAPHGAGALGGGYLWNGGLGATAGMYGGLGAAAGMYGGLNSGYMGGGLYGGMLGGAGGPQSHPLEAVIEILKADDFISTDAVVVITESAPTSASSPCPQGPILTEPDSQHHGYGGFGYAGASSMLDGYGSPFGHMSMGSMGPDFGVIAEVTLKAGLNTFTLRGLDPFTDKKQLAGRGLSVCSNAQIGVDGRPSCMDATFNCVKLGYTSNPESLIQQPLP